MIPSIENLNPGEGLILPDGRLVRRAKDGTLRLDGDPDAPVLHPPQEALISQYQRSKGLPATGTLDPATRKSLKG